MEKTLWFSKSKLSICILIVVFITILGWFWNFNYRCSISHPQGCNRRCVSDSDCYPTCSYECGCINVGEVCRDYRKCEKPPFECKCLNKTCQIVLPNRTFSLQEIRAVPWVFNDKIVEIEINNFSILGETEGKIRHLACENVGRYIAQISDNTSKAFLCLPYLLTLTPPTKLRVKVIAKTLCEVWEEPKTVVSKVTPCKKFYPFTSRNTEHWKFELDGVFNPQPKKEVIIATTKLEYHNKDMIGVLLKIT